MRIGCHVSIRGGYAEAAVRAARLGCTAFQYFPKNPRALGLKAFDRADARRCAEYCRERGIVSIAHAPYPVNLAVERPEQRARMAASLLNDLEIAEANGSIGVVVHFGIYKGADPLAGYRLIIEALNAVLGRWEGAAKLLLENQAGDHAPMGTTLEELVQIRRLCAYPERVGFCLDTCHLFASGQWNGRNEAEWCRRARELGYFDHLAAVHANDSLHESGRRIDRHAPLGAGRIGADGFRRLLAAPELSSLPVILETPETDELPLDRQMRLLREWMGEKKQ
ncbi:Endonuclease IV [Thermobacillus xylanilyticus]|jgi:deoxyribonuclease-4|uniref:Endonuclease IV n=1 Tax=Thermobacillus xylanilyticus TaxID=76633 RepID=A0ABM8V0H9_THEXY|nr:deoxyribonuclease IV [Thermobacillus xylanilyticus]REJ23301.1 MAG: endonuclease IV [Paenibacillaceae bacterium]CAG5079238.1 Endonuclease IV [Thermobacillus xylanilyticus]